MPEAFETVATRQRSELLFGLMEPLGVGQCRTLPDRLVAGFSAVGILGISDQPFTVEVDEACSPDGPFVATEFFASAIDSVTGLQSLCRRAVPCAPKMRLKVCNTGPSAATVLDICGTGIPKAPETEGGVQGPQGFQGFGMQGPQGFQGPQGSDGFQGPQGPQSFQGPQGDLGPQGSDGFQGPQGPQSFQGPQGDAGPQGPESFQGPQGPQSFQGPQGPGFQGPQGDIGSQGPQSFQGPQGPQGFQGPQGIVGSQGPQSFQGPQGPQSFQGPQGPQSFQGPQGPQGFQGPQAAVGPQGILALGAVIPYAPGSDLAGATVWVLGFGNKNSGVNRDAQSCFSCPRAGTISRIAVNVPVNALTATSNVSIRRSLSCNASFITQNASTVSIGAGVTGCFAMTFTGIAVGANDRIAFQVSNVGGSGAVSIRLSAGIDYV